MYKIMPHNKNSRPSHDIKIANKFFENLARFKYFETTVKQ